MAHSRWTVSLAIVACAGAHGAMVSAARAENDPGRFPQQVGALLPESPSGAAQPPVTPSPVKPGESAEAIKPETKTRATTALRGAPSETIRSLIARHAKEQGIPVSLADAVIRVESRYNPQARNGSYIGLSQISHRTARGIGYGGSVAGLFDPDTNLRYGIKYLAQAYRLAGGDTCGTVMRYQSGHGAKGMSAANRVYCGKVRTIVASN